MQVAEVWVGVGLVVGGVGKMQEDISFKLFKLPFQIMLETLKCLKCLHILNFNRND